MSTFPRPSAPVYNDKRIVVPLHSTKANGKGERAVARSVHPNTDTVSWSVSLAESSSVE